jgi:hypothetical protein
MELGKARGIEVIKDFGAMEARFTNAMATKEDSKEDFGDSVKAKASRFEPRRLIHLPSVLQAKAATAMVGGKCPTEHWQADLFRCGTRLALCCRFVLKQGVCQSRRMHYALWRITTS